MAMSEKAKEDYNYSRFLPSFPSIRPALANLKKINEIGDKDYTSLKQPSETWMDFTKNDQEIFEDPTSYLWQIAMTKKKLKEQAE